MCYPITKLKSIMHALGLSTVARTFQLLPWLLLFKDSKPEPCTIRKAFKFQRHYSNLSTYKEMILYGTATLTRMLSVIVSRSSFLSSAGATQRPLCSGTIFIIARPRSSIGMALANGIVNVLLCHPYTCSCLPALRIVSNIRPVFNLKI